MHAPGMHPSYLILVLSLMALDIMHLVLLSLERELYLFAQFAKNVSPYSLGLRKL